MNECKGVGGTINNSIFKRLGNKSLESLFFAESLVISRL